MNSEKENASPANQIIGQIIRNSEDSTNLIFTITNLSNEDILVPRELGSRGNAITFSLPSGNPSRFKNPNGSVGIPKAIKPNEQFSYQINNYEYFMLTLSTIERDQPGWFVLHWTMERENINESILVYYDYDLILKGLNELDD